MTGKSAHTATDIEQLATLLTNLLPISQGAAAPAPPEVGPPCVTAPRCLQVARWPACIAERLVGVADGQQEVRYEVSVGSAIPAVGLLIVMAGLVLTQIDDRLVAGSR